MYSSSRTIHISQILAKKRNLIKQNHEINSLPHSINLMHTTSLLYNTESFFCGVPAESFFCGVPAESVIQYCQGCISSTFYTIFSRLHLCTSLHCHIGISNKLMHERKYLHCHIGITNKLIHERILVAPFKQHS
jgi:hypothetical protein